MAEWEDATSYSQKEPLKGRAPRSWHLRVGWLSIKVHKHIAYDPDQWLLSADPFFRQHALQSPGVEAAQEEAVGIILQKLSQMIHDLQEVTK